MYGFIHCCLEDLVLKLFGDETWKEILKRSGIKLRGASFLMHKVYDDEVTLKLITTTSEVVGLDIDTCLEAFGNHFLKYCQKNGYDKILRVLGSNLYDFLTNLDNLHDHLSSIYPGMRAPSFRVTTTPDGLHLHYYSERKGLSAIVRGLVCIVSKEFFNTEVAVRTIDENSDGHVVLEVVSKDNDHSSSTKLTTHKPLQKLSAVPKDLPFSSATLCEAFPFHMIFSKDFRIIQIGNSLKRLSHTLWTANPNQIPKFNDLFTISRPKIELSFDSILHYRNQVFVVNSTGLFSFSRPALTASTSLPERTTLKRVSTNQSLDTSETVPTLRLKGQMVPVPESNCVMFLCSPRVNGLEEMKRLGLYMTDIPIHDRTRDLILMSHQRRGERELVEKLDEATNHIKILETKLRDENKRTEEILHNIFPAKVASLLCQNIRVEAESFEPVTLLFSDIVGFTAMCGSPCVEPMDVVRLLNKMYIQFDNLTNIYSVYKVETIGDAYVVVGGLPEQVVDHADRVVQMGLAMVKVTFTVMSPVDGKAIQMRIGCHSGSCMAGIVGLQMPRFCLFGNTVTLANKMESNSRPGQVHISDDTKRQLTRDKYIFVQSDQNVLPFPTYFVSKIDDNYSDHSLTVHSSLSTGGHFKSPSCSPTHTPKANSNVGTPLGETPVVSPYVSPRGSPTRKHSIYDIFCSKVQISSHFTCQDTSHVPDITQIPEVRVFQSTPVNSADSARPALTEPGSNQSTRRPVSRNGRDYSSPTVDTNHKKQRILSFVSDLTESRDSNAKNKSNEQNSDLIVSDKSGKTCEPSDGSPTKKTKKRYFLLCFGRKRRKNNMINQIKVKPKVDPNLQNMPNEKCIKDNVNNSIEDVAISGRHLDSMADSASAATSDTRRGRRSADDTDGKDRRRKKHILCCYLC